MLAFTLCTHPEAVEFTEQEFKQLQQRLSDVARRAVSRVENLEDKSNLIKTWVRIAFFSRMSHRSREPVSEEKLTAYYDSLDSARQEYLRSLPSEQMKRELESMYHNRRWLGSRAWTSGRGFGGNRGRRPGPSGRGGFGGNRRPPSSEGPMPEKPVPEKPVPEDQQPKNAIP